MKFVSFNILLKLVCIAGKMNCLMVKDFDSITLLQFCFVFKSISSHTVSGKSMTVLISIF